MFSWVCVFPFAGASHLLFLTSSLSYFVCQFKDVVCWTSSARSFCIFIHCKQKSWKSTSKARTHNHIKSLEEHPIANSPLCKTKNRACCSWNVFCLLTGPRTAVPRWRWGHRIRTRRGGSHGVVWGHEIPGSCQVRSGSSLCEMGHTGQDLFKYVFSLWFSPNNMRFLGGKVRKKGCLPKSCMVFVDFFMARSWGAWCSNYEVVGLLGLALVVWWFSVFGQCNSPGSPAGPLKKQPNNYLKKHKNPPKKQTHQTRFLIKHHKAPRQQQHQLRKTNSTKKNKESNRRNHSTLLLARNPFVHVRVFFSSIPSLKTCPWPQMFGSGGWGRRVWLVPSHFLFFSNP